MLDSKIATKKDLIEAFSDGKMPDGKDFESFINSVVMQSGSETAFDEKTMSMLTANEYQTLKGMQNNKFVTPLLLSKAFKGLLDPQFDALKAKDSALEAKDAELARVDAALQAQLDAKFLQLQNTLTGNMNTLYTRMLPIGSVIMWGLDLSLKPDNFEVCDGKKTFMYQGKSYTVPDLQGRFALGVGAGRDKNNKQLTFNLGDGVNKQNDIGEYQHQLSTSEMPSHKHTGYTDYAGEHTHANSKPNWIRGYTAALSKDQEVWGKTTDANTTSAGFHCHSFTTNATGGDTAHNNMPPYFALHYLIKIAN